MWCGAGMQVFLDRVAKHCLDFGLQLPVIENTVCNGCCYKKLADSRGLKNIILPIITDYESLIGRNIIFHRVRPAQGACLTLHIGPLHFTHPPRPRITSQDPVMMDWKFFLLEKVFTFQLRDIQPWSTRRFLCIWRTFSLYAFCCSSYASCRGSLYLVHAMVKKWKYIGKFQSVSNWAERSDSLSPIGGW